MMLQLALILFCIMAIPTAILTWYSGSQIIDNSEAAIGESTLAGLNANRKLNENAMANLAQDTSRLAATSVFDGIRSFETYDEINSSFNNYSRGKAVTNELLNLNRRVDGVASSYFYLDGSDYVVSTDKSVTKLERYEPMDWVNAALENQRGISGVWVPRKLDTGENVVSYVYPLNRLSSNTHGIIVVNMKESQIFKYLNATEVGNSNNLLLDSDGRVISFNDKSLLLSDGYELPFLGELLKQNINEGYAFRELDGKRMVYAWTGSALSGWWNVSWSSLDEMMADSRDMQGNIILLTGAIILLGTALAIFLQPGCRDRSGSLCGLYAPKVTSKSLIKMSLPFWTWLSSGCRRKRKACSSCCRSASRIPAVSLSTVCCAAKFRRGSPRCSLKLITG